jgi:hypothetical protein
MTIYAVRRLQSRAGLTPMVVVLVQAANGYLFFAAPHLPLHAVVFPAVASF